MSIDPTPSRLSTPAVAAPSGGPRVELASYPSLATLIESGDGTPGQRRPATPSVGLTSALLGALLLVAAAAVLVSRLARARGRNRHVGRIGRKSAAAPGFYTLFCRRLAKAGCRRKRGQTPLEYAAQLKQTGLIGPEFDDLFEYLYAISYHNRERQPSLEKALKRRIRALPKPRSVTARHSAARNGAE